MGWVFMMNYPAGIYKPMRNLEKCTYKFHKMVSRKHRIQFEILKCTLDTSTWKTGISIFTREDDFFVSKNRRRAIPKDDQLDLFGQPLPFSINKPLNIGLTPIE